MAKKKTRGHKPAPPADPFEMTPQDFESALEDAAVGGDSADGETPAEEHPGDTGPQGEETPPGSEQQAADPDGPIDLTIPKAEPDKAGAGQGEDVFEIVHHGQVHRVTRDKLINLAQKGFDYEQKVGPHQRIVALVESDPQAAALLDSYVRGQLAPQAPATPAQTAAATPPAQPPVPELKPLAEYESETEWLKDNIQAILASMQTPPAAPPAGGPAVQGQVMPAPAIAPAANMAPAGVAPEPVHPAVVTAETVLASRDPYGYPVVKHELDNYARRLLTAEQYALVNGGDIPALVRFYDQVRPRILRDMGVELPPLGTAAETPPAGKPPAGKPRGNPQFRVKPGGGTPPREEAGELSHAWEKNDEEFRRILNRAKGYE